MVCVVIVILVGCVGCVWLMVDVCIVVFFVSRMLFYVRCFVGGVWCCVFV